MAVDLLPTDIHRHSIEEYHQMVASGGFNEDSHVELLEGWIVDLSPRSPAHENALRFLIHWLAVNLDHAQYEFMVTGSLTTRDSEPEPDIAVLDRRPPTNEHPKHARLVVEVALTSKDRDFRVKPRIYAPAADEYWVVDLERRLIVIHRDPDADGYRTVMNVPAGQSPEPKVVPVGPLAAGELFDAAYPPLYRANDLT